MGERLTLTELQQLIRDSLYTSLPGFYWVIAEISDFKDNYAGHCYMELVEKHPDEVNVRAKIRGIIWSKSLRFIKPLFETSTGESLRSGLKVLLKVRIEYHEVYGLSLNIQDIDPAFTIGEMALRRQQIIRKLEEEGVISMNRELEFPLIPNRIAVISAASAAGYEDFMKHLKYNQQGYSFSTFLFEAVMQGNEAENSIINALDRISESAELFDIVVIVRGGGSQTDLSCFDNYNLAYHVTQFPLPVITGIGHEKDLSVTDLVAYRAEKTPTAVADFLIQSVSEAEEYLKNLFGEISLLSTESINKGKQILESARLRLVPLAAKCLSEAREVVASSLISLLKNGKDYISRWKSLPATQSIRLRSLTGTITNTSRNIVNELKNGLRAKALTFLKNKAGFISGREEVLDILNPFNVLQRGFTITSVDGIMIKSARQLKEGETIETRFKDARVRSKITRINRAKR